MWVYLTCKMWREKCKFYKNTQYDIYIKFLKCLLLLYVVEEYIHVQQNYTEMPANDKHQISLPRELEGRCSWGGGHTKGFSFIANVSFLKLRSEQRGVCCITFLRSFVYVIINFSKTQRQMPEKVILQVYPRKKYIYRYISIYISQRSNVYIIYVFSRQPKHFPYIQNIGF